MSEENKDQDNTHCQSFTADMSNPVIVEMYQEAARLELEQGRISKDDYLSILTNMEKCKKIINDQRVCEHCIFLCGILVGVLIMLLF